jgi:hypothetical protein
MWDGFELPGEVRRHQLPAALEEEERLMEAGELDAATELNLAFWAPTIADRLRPMTRWSLELEIDEIEKVDLSAVRARTLVAVGEHDKRDFHAIAELADAFLHASASPRPPSGGVGSRE